MEVTKEMVDDMAKRIAFAGRDRNDRAEDAIEFWAYTGEHARAIAMKQAAAALAAIPGEPVGVKVKPLEWKLNSETQTVSEVFFGRYFVERNPSDRWCWGLSFHGEQGIGLYPADNFEAAKAAAQADYEQCILSALTPPATVLPQDVINLVIAAREFWEVSMDDSNESAVLDNALEAFSSRVPFDNEPDEDEAALTPPADTVERMREGKQWYSTRWNPLRQGGWHSPPGMGEDKTSGGYVRFDEAKVEIDRLRAALAKLRSYNVDIMECRINHRPADHIQVVDAALPPPAPVQGGEGER